MLFPPPHPGDMFLRQRFSSPAVPHLGAHLGAHLRSLSYQPHSQGMGGTHMSTILDVATTIHWHRTNCKLSKDFIWTAQNHLHPCLLLVKIPHHRGCPERDCVNNGAASLLGSRETSKDRALMRKEGANEKSINPNLSVPSTVRHVKFHQLYIFKLILKWPFHRKRMRL